MAWKFEQESGVVKHRYWCNTNFFKWRLYMTSCGWVRIEFQGKNGFSVSSPRDPELKWKVNFDKDSEWDKFEEEATKAFNKQKKKFPDRWKEQRASDRSSINGFIKDRKTFMKDPKVKFWVDTIKNDLNKHKNSKW